MTSSPGGPSTTSTAYPLPNTPQYPSFPSSLSPVEPPTPVNHPAPAPPPVNQLPLPPLNHHTPPVGHRPPVNHHAHHGSTYGTLAIPQHHHIAPPQHGYIQHNQPPYMQHNGPQSNTSLSPDVTQGSPPSKPTGNRYFPHIEYTSEAFPPAPPIPPNSAPEGHFDLLPPANSTHPSWEALYAYAQEHASIHGYALSINTTEKNRCRVKLCCVCYGKAKNTRKLTPDVRVRRHRASQKTGCRMNIDCKKHPDGNWTLRVRQAAHNHAGRASEAWSLQRKRTWGTEAGAEGRKVGTGGVTARAERNNSTENNNKSTQQGQTGQTEEANTMTASHAEHHSLKNGSLVWKIIEQEMLTKLGPGHGHDRGVGRTVRILEEKLPGISIFKRDVYNIRAQIRRMRKEAGQEVGHMLDDSEDDGAEGDGQQSNKDENMAQIDPGLIAQCNSALQHMPHPDGAELERLREEVKDLRATLDQYKKDLDAKNNENTGLRMQLELANMAMYNVRGTLA